MCVFFAFCRVVVWSALNNLDIAGGEGGARWGSWRRDWNYREDGYERGQGEGTGCEETKSILNASERVVHFGGRESSSGAYLEIFTGWEGLSGGLLRPVTYEAYSPSSSTLQLGSGG